MIDSTTSQRVGAHADEGLTTRPKRPEIVFIAADDCSHTAPPVWQPWGMSPVVVNVDNFARAESDRMFAAIQAQAGGVNQWFHYRAPTPIDQQTVIRMNRDTLYSAAVVDISDGARLIVPDAGRRYVSVMIVNQDHYVNGVFHEPGEHVLATGQFGTPVRPGRGPDPG